LPGVSARHCDCALAAAFGSDGERIAAMLHDDIAARQDAGARLDRPGGDGDAADQPDRPGSANRRGGTDAGNHQAETVETGRSGQHGHPSTAGKGGP
jgi:hypothetical protein